MHALISLILLGALLYDIVAIRNTHAAMLQRIRKLERRVDFFSGQRH